MKTKKTDTEKKLILWEGFRKELPWMLFWILLGVMTYGYYQDKQICDDVLSDPCGVCYKLNQTLMNPNNLLDGYANTNGQDDIYINIPTDNLDEINISVNDSLIENINKDPDARTVSNYSY